MAIVIVIVSLWLLFWHSLLCSG